jgi:hypothetical protein
VVSLSCRLGIARETKVSIKKIKNVNLNKFLQKYVLIIDRFCDLVVRVSGYRNGVHSASCVQLRSYLEEKVAASV